jgi:nucleoside-diphosphate-sugar epimerase
MGKPVSLFEIAGIIAKQMQNNKQIVILKEGMSNEYTANNRRLLQEIGNYNFTSLIGGIDKQIAWQRGFYEQSTNR